MTRTGVYDCTRVLYKIRYETIIESECLTLVIKTVDILIELAGFTTEFSAKVAAINAYYFENRLWPDV